MKKITIKIQDEWRNWEPRLATGVPDRYKMPHVKWKADNLDESSEVYILELTENCRLVFKEHDNNIYINREAHAGEEDFNFCL